jgi:hypothetical protein
MKLKDSRKEKPPGIRRKSTEESDLPLMMGDAERKKGLSYLPGREMPLDGKNSCFAFEQPDANVDD